jgi:multiple sugar transport system substrate-binding protein
MVELAGSSWNHERGHAPLVATAAEYERITGKVCIRWSPRSLKEFGVSSVEDLARRYDLIVIDHPHVGLIAESGCAVAIDEATDPDGLRSLASGSPGRSHGSYYYAGHQWALAIDAACQVSAWRPDLLPHPPMTWAEVADLSRSGRVLWPLCDVDAAASMLTLLATLEAPATFITGHILDRNAARRGLALMREIALASDPRCLTANPIGALEALSDGAAFCYAPLTFGYLNYARAGHRGAQVRFGDIPRFGAADQPRGALLGGAGLAVSAYSQHRDAAVSYALYVASAGTQRSTYLAAGGQPAHGDVWSDAAADEVSGGFFTGTGPTMEASWTRPRDPRFVQFQNEMIELFGHSRRWLTYPEEFLDDLEACYRRHQGLPSQCAREHAQGRSGTPAQRRHGA